MPNFQVFKRRDAYRTPDPYVTVGQKGTVKFNPAAMRALGSPGAVVFLVAKDERLLGFKSGDVVTNDAGRRKGVGNAQLIRTPGSTASATHVLRYLDVDLGKSRRYPLVDIDGTQCIDLKQPGTVVTSNRAATREERSAH